MQVDPSIPAAWALTPLRGKVPLRTGWQSEPPLPREQLERHTGNLGLRTGQVSGVVVIDIDPAHGGERPRGLPDTITCITGSGGTHLYYSCTVPISNSAGKLARGVDVRGDGGQVVFPGSTHPGTGRQYAWLVEHAPGQIPLAPLPAWVLLRLAITAKPYAAGALDGELARLWTAEQGERNDRLNVAALKLSQLVAGGELPREQTITLLRAVALAIGLEPGEIDPTIRSGFAAGSRSPRTAPEARVTRAEHTILIPGEHVQGDSGEIAQQGTDSFAVAVLETIPGDLLYRRDRIVGEIVGPQGSRSFATITPDRLRLWIDHYCQLARWTKTGKHFQACTKDLAGVVLACAETHARVRSLRFLTRHPVFAGDAWELSLPGWNDSTGVLYDEPADLAGIGPAPFDDRLIPDLITDFPFRDDASQINLLGLMLTPLIRPAVDCVPLHLVQSSIERTGKGLLISAVLGHAILGERVPAVQLGEREEEREKRITSMILAGDTIVHLDNIPAASILESPSLASLITSTLWKGRTLGVSQMPKLPNTLTLVASANNLRASGELAKRIVPIWLEPASDHPETRSDFDHPDILAYSAAKRREVVACLLGMAQRWIDAGRAPGTHRLGGFEAWASAIGGILALHGLARDWLANRQEWTEQADEWGQDTRRLVDAWFCRHGSCEITASEILALIVEEKLFPVVLAKPESARLQSLGRSVLSQLCNRPVGKFRVRRYMNTDAKANRYFLQDLG
jgi:hypothetical protein